MRYIEWRLICDRVRVVVMHKFCMGDPIGPRTGVASTEDSKVHFDLLVDTFSLTVGLWVVCSRKGEAIVEEFSKLFGKGEGKL